MEQENKKDPFLPLSILASSIILAAAWTYTSQLKDATPQRTVVSQRNIQASQLEEEVLPAQGVELPVVWGDLGVRLVEKGVIDLSKLKSIHKNRGLFPKEYNKLLTGKDNGKLIINSENSGFILNLLWALGLAQNNPILSDESEIANPRYSEGKRPVSGFASTAGWTVSIGDPIDHYNAHKFFELTAEQQALVDRISRGIYRPCCNNSTHFPDCNHGMAMLALLELMASQGVSEQDIWRTALAVNSYWFPNNYLTIATYMKGRGVEWKDVNPQEVLGVKYSSGSGYRDISSKVLVPIQNSREGNGCGVDTGPAIQRETQQSDCGT